MFQPVLDFLVTKGPYRFCRHPQYLSFIIIVFGFDCIFGSVIGFVYTIVLSIPSVVFRAKVEDKLLREEFGKMWEQYAGEVGFLLPKYKR